MKKCEINYFKTRLHRILKYDCLQLGQKDHDTLENSKADVEQGVVRVHFSVIFYFPKIKIN
jgi:hypothetical protein